MSVRSCKVPIQDMEGVTHTVEVTAETLYEAVAGIYVSGKARLSCPHRSRGCSILAPMWGGTMTNDNERRVSFDELVAELRTVVPGRVTVVSYSGLKFALDCGIDIIDDYAETYTLQAVIRDHGTPAQKQRLKETILAGRWSTETKWTNYLT